jgi:F-type H+-transporting ATPase subunit b
MPQLDFSTYLPQFFWLVITFVALYLVMWKLAVPSITNTLESRQKRIEDNLEKAAKAKQEAEATLDAYEKSINEARAEAQKINVTTINKLTKEIEDSEIIVVDELSRIIAKNELEIKTALDNAEKKIRISAIDIASDAIYHLTGKVPDEGQLKDAIERAQEMESQETR